MSENFEIESLGGNCPVQAEGIVDGQPFYFRARGNAWSMSIGGDVYCQPDWYMEETYGRWPDAGWMSEEEAMAFIEKSVASYRKEMEIRSRLSEEQIRILNCDKEIAFLVERIKRLSNDDQGQHLKPWMFEFHVFCVNRRIRELEALKSGSSEIVLLDSERAHQHWPRNPLDGPYLDHVLVCVLHDIVCTHSFDHNRADSVVAGIIPLVDIDAMPPNIQPFLNDIAEKKKTCLPESFSILRASAKTPEALEWLDKKAHIFG